MPVSNSSFLVQDLAIDRLVRAIRDAVIVAEATTGRIVLWNQAAAKILGYSASEASEMNVEALVPERLKAQLRADVSGYSRTGHERYTDSTKLLEFPAVRKDGAEIWIEMSLSPIEPTHGVGSEGERYVLAIVRDITERKRAEEALSHNEERFRLLVEGVKDYAIFMLDPDGRVVSWNEGARRIKGYSHQEILGRHFSVCYPEEDIERGKPERGLEIAREKGTYEAEGWQVRKDGSRFWANFLITAIRDEAGGLRSFAKVTRDITERKQTERALVESERRFRQLFENSADALFVHDDQGRFVDCNVQACRVLGYTREELLERTVADVTARLISEKERRDKKGKTLWARALRGEPGRIVGFDENELVRKDGSTFPVEVGVGAIEYGGQRMIFVSARDISDRKRAEDKLRQSLGLLLALREAGHVLGSTLESEEVVTRLLEIMRGVSSLTAAVISRPNEEGNLRIWHSVGLDALWPRARFTPEAESARRAALEDQEQRLFQLRHPSSEDRLLTGLMLPLRAKDYVLGVLEVYGPKALGEGDTVEILNSLASQAASALENALLYEELEEREHALQDLVGKLLGTQEEERRRVAYEVHDGLAQAAAAAHQHLQTFGKRYPLSGERRERDFQRILRLVRGTVSDARRIIANLRPTALDDLGLAAAISLEVDNLQEEGYQVDYEDDLGDVRLKQTVEIALFRVAQEALTNMRKHAQTSQVRIALRRQGEMVRLEVEDSGKGFDPNASYLQNGPGERVGFAGMRERVSMLGGRLEIHSQPGFGTSITATVPWEGVS
jgi:PAS domain S-box-containing protein